MRFKFWVSWTYIGNYSERPQTVEAVDETAAVHVLFDSYSDEFKAKATFYVTSEAPVQLHATIVWPKPLSIPSDDEIAAFEQPKEVDDDGS